MSSLIENAFIHGFEGIEVGQIKIGYKLLKDTLEFTVEDNGRGIDETLQTKIFEPFYSTSVNHNKGSGLGLSIVYNLVTQKLNGQVVCRSKHDEYCRFIVTMPLLSVDNIENKNKQQDNG
ncbi:ATP-binding protein [Psychrosphaera sp. G1-22]|uniref:histidine kinase n=1 Tax=Psychrosphaera algicola TaxID=3023714 RepID=A0ABT5FFH3_9GAMM|nr:ATP-binding protein [Psychrosphaera sp. G1-22]MDC2889804.1 ATP-binding protein [Psychrosphaera sp. G1-22]